MSKNNKGLGRGIDALFQDFSNMEPVDVKTEKVLELPLIDLRPNPYQPRKIFDQEALKELSLSIAQSGVFQPIIVRQSVKGYEIIAGERRYRASIMAGKETIPAIIRDFDDEYMMHVAVLENLQREDLSALEEAEAYEMLMKNLGLTQAELAEKLGKSRPYIANYLRILTLPALVKELLQANEISMGLARTLLGLKDTKQIVPVAKRAVKEQLTVRQLEKLVSDLNENKQTPVVDKTNKKTKKNVYLVESEERLMDKFGTNVQIQEKAGKGKIEIEYLSQEDLTRILDILEIQFDE